MTIAVAVAAPYVIAAFNRYTRIRVAPISGPIGAQVDCGPIDALDPVAVAELRQAWLDHLVLLIRGQKLGDEQLMRVGRLFGELEPSPPTSVMQDAHRPNRFISIVSNILKDGKPIGALGNDEAIWHTDMSNQPTPPAASILTSHQVPPGGGETGFINMYEALATLPSSLRRQIEGRTIYHDGGHNSAGVKRRLAISTSHPIVRTHPDTGVNALYLGRRRNARIDGLPDAESDALLDALWKHATTRYEAWHHAWSIGDTIIWDNRCVIHHRNPFDPAALRLMHRTQTCEVAPFHRADSARTSHPRGMLHA